MSGEAELMEAHLVDITLQVELLQLAFYAFLIWPFLTSPSLYFLLH